MDVYGLPGQGQGGKALEALVNGLKTMFPGRAVAITPDDGNDLVSPGVIVVTGAGTVKVTPANPETPTPVTFTVAAGAYVPLVVKRVWSSDTTATGLILVW